MDRQLAENRFHRLDPAAPRRTGRRCRAAFAASMLLAFVPLAQARNWDVDELMRTLAQHAGGRAAFVERKYLAVLDRPIESSGELVFTPPRHMEKRTLKPKPEVLVIDADNLSVEREGRSYSALLSQYPEVAALIDSVRATLAGDLGALRSQYRVELDGSAAHWTLTLLPSDTRVAALVLRIRIAGSGDAVRSVEILQADGDRSLMNIDRIEAQ